MQGLNYVAALLLLVMKTEEDAFWMLAVLLENVLFNDCYTYNLSGCHVDQRVLRELLAKKCPRLSLIILFYFLVLFGSVVRLALFAIFPVVDEKESPTG